MIDWKFALALVFAPRKSVWKLVASDARKRMFAKQFENNRLRAALTAAGIPAQAGLDDKAPPMRITVERAREIMGMVEDKKETDQA